MSDPSSPDQANFSPNLHSTPTQRNLPHSPQTNNDSNVDIPGLLNSLSSSPSSASLKSWSDLDSFLPFAVTPTHDNSLSHDTPDLVMLTPDPSSPQAIPTVMGVHPPLQQVRQPRTPCRQTVRRDNRVVTALSLPNIMVTNHLSIFPKFNNLVDEILENEMHLGLHSEVWEDKEKAAHANTIEVALELHGIQYISTPRPNRCGGGAAITLISDRPFLLTKLDISVMSGDQSLEVCWGFLKPRKPTGHIKSLIICAFYLPPNSRKKSTLI